VRYLDYLRFLFDKRNASPVYLIHYISDRCNARCSHCFLNFEDVPRNQLALWEIKEVAKHLGPHIYSIMLTGGEPFLRGDVAEIVSAYFDHSNASYIQVSTNGSLPKRIVETTRTILTKYPKRQFGIALSLDAIGEHHDSIRGFPGLFDKAIATHQGLHRLKAAHLNFQLNVNITVSHFNQDNLQEMYNYLTTQLGAEGIFSTLTRGNSRDQLAKEVDLVKYETFTKWCEQRMKVGSVRGFRNFFLADIVNAQNILTRKRVVETVKTDRYLAPCYAGWLSGVIYSDGTVASCEATGVLPPQKHKMGNLREYDHDLSQLWASERAEQVRRAISDSKCFCTHECFMICNILFNPRYLPYLATETLLLRLGRLARRLRQAQRAGFQKPPNKGYIAAQQHAGYKGELKESS
jgi:MoaA/NifB/PqqE/SkfB family radical SAM enzyme